MTLKTAVLAAGLLFATAQAGAATTLTFEGLAEGTTLSNQYAAQGAIFSPNAFSGPGGPTGDWATNTDMTITSSASGDVGDLGSPSLVSGNILHAFGFTYDGWFSEDGDPSFLITFTTPISSISIDFAGILAGADVRIFAYSGTTLLGSVAAPDCATPNCQSRLTFSAASITSVAVTPGSYDDWVGVDNVTFAPVPEPATYGMMALGLGLVAFRRRTRR